MERRWTTRTQLQLAVEVSQEGGTTLHCTTRDIGLGGVFVNVGRRALPEGQNVELTFRLPTSTPVEECRLRAKVVRAADEGAGLIFRDFDATAFRSLQKVMRSRDSAV
jgi:hypothetical protein